MRVPEVVSFGTIFLGYPTDWHDPSTERFIGTGFFTGAMQDQPPVHKEAGPSGHQSLPPPGGVKYIVPTAIDIERMFDLQCGYR